MRVGLNFHVMNHSVNYHTYYLLILYFTNLALSAIGSLRPVCNSLNHSSTQLGLNVADMQPAINALINSKSTHNN